MAVAAACRRPPSWPAAVADRRRRRRRSRSTTASTSQTTEALVTAFEKQTGIHVNVRSDDEDVFANQIVQEGPRSPADVIYTENSPPSSTSRSGACWPPSTPSTLARSPPSYNSPRGDWVGVSARVSVMVYNTDLLKADQLPTSVMDLAEPRVAGQAGPGAG